MASFCTRDAGGIEALTRLAGRAAGGAEGLTREEALAAEAAVEALRALLSCGSPAATAAAVEAAAGGVLLTAPDVTAMEALGVPTCRSKVLHSQALLLTVSRRAGLCVLCACVLYSER